MLLLSVRLFPLYLLHRLTFECDVLYVHVTTLARSTVIDSRGHRSSTTVTAPLGSGLWSSCNNRHMILLSSYQLRASAAGRAVRHGRGQRQRQRRSARVGVETRSVLPRSLILLSLVAGNPAEVTSDVPQRATAAPRLAVRSHVTVT